jgi:phosphate-selective porin
LPVFGNVRVGHIKEDLSFYNASSGRNIPFMERPNVWDAIEDPYIFDNGIMMSRTYLDDLLYVSLGLFMTNTRTGAFTVSPGAPLAFDVRVCYMPIYNEEDQHWMNIGATGSVRANPYERGTELPVGQTTVAPLVRAGISSQVPNIINTRPFYTREGTQLYTLCYNHSWGPFSMGAQYDGQFFNQIVVFVVRHVQMFTVFSQHGKALSSRLKWITDENRVVPVRTGGNHVYGHTGDFFDAI